jgi:predicted DNA-binding transcriptional regulator AlpA
MPKYGALPPNLPPRCLRREAAASYVGVSPNTFDDWISEGWMPEPRTIGGCKLWDRRQLDAALDALFERKPRSPWDDTNLEDGAP